MNIWEKHMSTKTYTEACDFKCAVIGKKSFSTDVMHEL